MSETSGTPALNEALAKFQASLPRVGKDNTAKVKSDKANYTYKYADLADVSQAVEPALGAVGLAFTARPTMRDGSFALVYQLTHISGEELEGIYPLPDPLKFGPQVIGSAITYARRYCLCAVAGIHPDGEDDDAARAQSAPYSAASAWESAAPRTQRQPANGQTVRPAADTAPAEPPGPKELDPDAQPYADEAFEARTLAALKDVNTRARDKHKLASLITNPATGGTGGLGQFIGWRRKQLEEVESALTALNDAANAARMPTTEVDIHVKQVTGKDIESASAAELRQAAEALTAVPA